MDYLPTLDDTKKRSRTHHYPLLAWHGVRTLLFLCAAVVAAIFASFAATLYSASYKIPWTFLLLLIISFLTLVAILFSTCTLCCGSPSPLLQLSANSFLLFLWIGSTGLLTYNLYGTLAHSCSLTNWGNSTGSSICSLYKVVFSACIFAILALIALIVLDVRAKKSMTRSGRYSKMAAESTTDFKMSPITAGPRPLVDRADTGLSQDTSYTSTLGRTDIPAEHDAYTGPHPEHAAYSDPRTHMQDPALASGASTYYHEPASAISAPTADSRSMYSQPSMPPSRFNSQQTHTRYQESRDVTSQHSYDYGQQSSYAPPPRRPVPQQQRSYRDADPYSRAGSVQPQPQPQQHYQPQQYQPFGGDEHRSGYDSPSGSAYERGRGRSRDSYLDRQY